MVYDYSGVVFTRPCLKWVGGKTQIITHVIDTIPDRMVDYHEIFTGGGSVLLAVLSMRTAGKITIERNVYAYDINESLINLWVKIQEDPSRVWEALDVHARTYAGIETKNGQRKSANAEDALVSKESYYYWTRDLFNTQPKNTFEHAAMFIFINKTCWRGLYRESAKGKFNVPFGNYVNANMPTQDELIEISELVRDVKFECCDFTESMQNITQGDFTYLDPPYALENATSFVGYSSSGFNLATHNTLFELIESLEDADAKFTMSNAKVNLVTERFSDKYNIIDVEARRAINSKDPSSRTTEVLVTSPL